MKLGNNSLVTYLATRKVKLSRKLKLKLKKPSMRRIVVLSFWIIDYMNFCQIGILKVLRKIKTWSVIKTLTMLLAIGEYATLTEPFITNVPIFYPLRIPENLCFSGNFVGY